MKFLQRVVPWLLVILIILAALYLPDLGPENYKDFDSLFANERGRQGIAGYEIAIIKNGEIAFNKAYGFDGQRRPLEKSTPLYLGPASEILTGTLLCQFVNERKISLDVPIAEFIPELASLKARRAGASSLDMPLTLRQLAAHRVAFPEKDLPDYDPAASGLEAGLPDPELFLKSHFPTENYTRSRLSYRIVGAILEKESNKKFSDLLESMITIPLGMYLTTARPSSLEHIAVGSGSFFGLTFPYLEKVPYDAAASDGIVTTSQDMAKFLNSSCRRSAESGSRASPLLRRRDSISRSIKTATPVSAGASSTAKRAAISSRGGRFAAMPRALSFIPSATPRL
jgi:CubicO group peptidase (beta-lactamase class C family)